MKNVLYDIFAYTVGIILIASAILIPTTAVAWCIEYWINLLF